MFTELQRLPSAFNQQPSTSTPWNTIPKGDQGRFHPYFLSAFSYSSSRALPRSVSFRAGSQRQAHHSPPTPTNLSKQKQKDVQVPGIRVAVPQGSQDRIVSAAMRVLF